ncbi:putative serine/threonine protein kinase KKQ8 KNAG_0C01040 [Huiozyma naganishii CBS 8797]|uniref:non-specific serine/threonine protein kinase n=1 Tax=Huiozyma naganishii (strain ATCC MYA-139 / BCRC 22969 / CBS 8797 / KCTC 17520 / NBRC 10181 / NCYC 3082 / Yp74L-3) TaxID=1071383 RepID=J7RW56_HUIN7|nr:hypothetical protein KNAG_0C01040 [Kazachstania naganishii CBS 8797]CCK69217.1 hypothetical protein KNAG_0C01040 [Kazachstania naganishii CBS 8797]
MESSVESMQRSNSLGSRPVRSRWGRRRGQRARSTSITNADVPRNHRQHYYASRGQPIVCESANFTLFESGLHEHRIELVPFLTENSEPTEDSRLEDFIKRRKRQVLKIPKVFKYKKPAPRMESALSLLPANDDAFDLNEKFRDLGLQDSHTALKLDNEAAAIGPKDLKLISDLSSKINSSLQNQFNSKPDPDDTGSLKDRYGTHVRQIGCGLSGKIFVYVKTIGENDTSNGTTYSKDNKWFYAIKEFRKRKTGELTENYSAKIISEFVIGKALSTEPLHCPNIVKVLDLMETGKNPSVFVEVMEFCPSGDLYSYISRLSKKGTKMHPLEADCFLKQLLLGVQFLHFHGIAHCDIKLENLLLCPDGLLKICDFGSSYVFQTAWESTVHFERNPVGSEPYIAPEEFVVDREYDPRLVDCWSCGVAYMCMIVGRFIWHAAKEDTDAAYANFCREISQHGRYGIFEELTHHNVVTNLLRKKCLYKVFQPRPTARLSVREWLNNKWMKQVECCQEHLYEH